MALRGNNNLLLNVPELLVVATVSVVGVGVVAAGHK